MKRMSAIDGARGLAADRSICFVAPFAHPLLTDGGVGAGGAERQFFLFGRALAARGWRISFITDRPAPPYSRWKTIFPTYYADFSYLGGSKWRTPACWLSLLRAMRKADAAFYVLKVPGHLLPVMSLYCRGYRRKLAHWFQGSYEANLGVQPTLNRFVRFLHDLGVHCTDLFIAQTREQQEAFARNFHRKAHLVRSICGQPNLLRGDDAHPGMDVLWVGSTLPLKRPEVVLELARQMPEVRFAMATNISDQRVFAQLQAEAGAIPNLQFLGQVPPAAMERWFARTRVFLNTSLREGFPNTYLQAWAQGIPVVSLEIDPDRLIQEKGLGLVISPGQTGLLAPDPAYLAKALRPGIQYLLENEDVRQAMGERALRHVRENHAADVVVSDLIDILNA